MALRTLILTAALGCGLSCTLGLAVARAQHVVTDMEAGKLTLDALTATPRVIYRPILAVRRVHRVSYVSRTTHLSRSVAFHRHAWSRSTRRKGWFR